MKFYIKNCYGIACKSTHKTAEKALKKADRKEGVGWYVEDEDGQSYEWREVFYAGEWRKQAFPVGA